ncbi:MAG: hypothetical protein GF330_03085 [Candidatus Eisenbacteria bacterium]|nr:hypothetical protein [Candidatus Eisenbacteria bacterium]
MRGSTRADARGPGSLRIALWALLCAGLVGCGIEAPEAPEFETTLVVPINPETYTGLDMANDLDAVEGDSAEAGPLAIRASDDLDPIGLQGGLRCTLGAQSLEASFSEIDFAPPEIPPQQYRLDQIIPGLPEGGLDTVVDSFSIGPLTKELGTFAAFDEMRFDSGRLSLVATNGFPFPAGGDPAAGHAVVLVVEDWSVSPAREVARYEITETIAPGESYAAEFDLSGAVLGNHLILSLAAWCPGSGGEVIHLDPADGIDLTLAFVDCVVCAVSGHLPSYELTDRESIALDADLSIQSAVIASGQVAWDVTSSLPVSADVEVALPDALRAGSPLLVTGQVPANGAATIEVDLAGVEIAGDDLTALTCHALVHTDSAQTPSTLELGQGVAGELVASEMAFDSIRGVLGPREVAIEPSAVEIDFPEEAAGMTFTAAEARLEMQNRSDIPLTAELALLGCSHGDSVRVAFTAEIPPGTAEAPSQASVALDETNSEILALANLQPEEVWLEGAVWVGDGQSVCELRAEDYLSGNYSVQVPMKMTLDTAHHEGEAFEMEIEESARERIDENLEQVSLQAEIENHFPTGVRVCFHFARSAEALFVNDELQIETEEIPAATVDPITGRVSEALESSLTLSIVPDQVGFFAEPNVHGAVEVTLVGQGAEAFEIWTTDYVTIRGLAELHCRIR